MMKINNYLVCNLFASNVENSVKVNHSLLTYNANQTQHVRFFISLCFSLPNLNLFKVLLEKSELNLAWLSPFHANLTVLFFSAMVSTFENLGRGSRMEICEREWDRFGDIASWLCDRSSLAAYSQFHFWGDSELHKKRYALFCNICGLCLWYIFLRQFQ